MAHNWTTTKLTNIQEVKELIQSMSGNGWMYRGQSKRFNMLIPSIDRGPYQNFSRLEKLDLERSSIEAFQTNATDFAGEGERQSKNSKMIALMVLRHYGVPTRVLDWSSSVYISLYFAVAYNDSDEGELWTFNRELYEEEGAKQWIKFPETTFDASGDRNKFDVNMPTAFVLNKPADWFVCLFYDHNSFPRQRAQQGAYSFTPRFNKDHAVSIEELLKDHEQFSLYIIASDLKPALRDMLKTEYGIWRGPLFP